MPRAERWPVWLALLCILFTGLVAQARAMSDAEALALGHQIAAIQAALQDPTAPGSLQAVTDLGLDQRYYVMVRGWLAYRLQGVRSRLAADPGQAGVLEQVEFLERAIRAIDLE